MECISLANTDVLGRGFTLPRIYMGGDFNLYPLLLGGLEPAHLVIWLWQWHLPIVQACYLFYGGERERKKEKARERDCPALSVWQSMKRKTMIRETRAMRISRRLNCASPVRRTEEEACHRGNIFKDFAKKMPDSFYPILHTVVFLGIVVLHVMVP